MRDDGLGARNRWWLVAATGLAVFTAQLDVTIVNVALPTIEHDFGIGTSLTEWVVLGYVLPLIALSLPSGRWLDRVGRREALTLAVTGFTAAGVAAGLAPGIGWLLAARVAQGAFGAALFALVPVLTTIAVRPEARGRAMAVVMTLGPLGAVAGPALGGLVIESLGWPWIFYLNVPVGLLVIAIAWPQLPPGPRLRLPDRAWAAETGLLGTAAVMVMLSLSLAAADGPGWFPLILAAVPFVLAWWRLPAGRPVRELLAVPGMGAPHLALLMEMAAVMTIQFLIPFHLMRGGASPSEIGLTMLALPAGVMAAGLCGGLLSDRLGQGGLAGAGRTTVGGMCVLILGLASFETFGYEPVPSRLALPLVLVGVGAGLFAGPNQTMAMFLSPRHLLATTGATTSLARQLGVAFGPALATVTWSLSGYRSVRPVIGVAFCLALLGLLALLRRSPSAPEGPATSAPLPERKEPTP
ncbi:MFS transporter [Actinomadura sp. 6K520]|uniref:MFS transporter n=1 Tax=Actinomadura sp. 6K520 TaxID=2530364 RepID=UPI001046F9F4|nr:MFS transporter [Actinomadura sp. 6K520]TDE37682.1 MFS transporter [Actinomadura sp. 6K520]